MKKRMTLVLTGLLISGFTSPTTSFAHTEHGSEDGAVVDIEQGDVKDSLTEFYLNVDKDAVNPDEGKDIVVEPGDGNEDDSYVSSKDGRISYDIFFDISGSFKLDVTIPLYVCMYAYGVDGSVITPSTNAYAIENKSQNKEGSEVSIGRVVQKTPYVQIISNDPEANNGLIEGVSYSVQDNSYTFYSKAPADTAAIENYKDVSGMGYNSSGNWYAFFYKDGTGFDFKKATDLDGSVFRKSVFPTETDSILLEVDVMYKDVTFPKEEGIYIGLSKDRAGEEGLKVRVTEIKSHRTTWTMKPANTPGKSLQAGDFVMTLKPTAAVNQDVIDVSEIMGGKDITSQGWDIDANDKLGIDIFAKIAGGSVNKTEHVPVVQVSYKVVPIF